MAEKIRVGLVGASPEGGSWGVQGHIPALKMLPDYELKAICTAHEDTAKRSAEMYGAELAYHDYNRMFANPDIDLVSVAVRVPYHHEITMAALKAGKNVYCEWPLGANLREAEEMADLATSQGVHTMVGLQARSDATLTYLRKLLDEDYVGEVLACHMTFMSGASFERNSARLWTADRTKGANAMTIEGGHNIDALCFLLGEFAEVSAKVATQIKQVKVTDTGQTAEVTSPDNILVSGVLESGALAAVYVGSVPNPIGGGWKLEIYGAAGTVTVAGAQANYAPAPLKLMGAKGNEPLAELPLPDEYVLVPEGTPQGAPYNVAQAYTRLADGLRAGHNVDPDFGLAVRRHRLLEAMEQSSAEGRAVKLS